jgi:hypothetical protein
VEEEIIHLGDRDGKGKRTLRETLFAETPWPEKRQAV